VRKLGVRANADTPADARMARDFGAEGIGLCRTEHMFFDRRAHRRTRNDPVRNDWTSAAALAKLLPMQREDFVELFEIMAGLPVTIRLLDPPLHEFLPQARKRSGGRRQHGRSIRAFARTRVVELDEFNPMLGHRGCRLR
jgi:pyruvate,orthophosphate dikinase